MRYLCLLFIPFLFSNCNKEEALLFRMEYMEEFEITAGLSPILTHHFLSQNILTNRTTYLNTFSTSEADIVAINPGNARFDAVFSSATYDIIEEVSIRIYETDPNDYQEIYYRENVPLNTGGDLVLIPTLVDVKDLLLKDNFNIDIAIQFRQAPPQFIETRFTFDFIVK